MKRFSALLLATVIVAGPVSANSLVTPGPREKIARSTFSAKPAHEWNKLSFRGGKKVEIWTIDGDALNKVSFYGGILVGEPLFKEADKKDKPLPRVTPNMLITDIPVLLETSYRSQGLANQMSIDSQEPATISGKKGVRFTYSFVRSEDEVQRKGEAVGAVVGDKLYLVTYEAPSIYFFDKDVEKARQLVSTLKF